MSAWSPFRRRRARPSRRDGPANAATNLSRPPRSVPVAAPTSRDRVEHLVERHRIEREHLGPASEVGNRVVDRRDVDGAHGTEILGHDEVGFEIGEGAAIESVQVLASGHALLDDGIDAGGVETLGERRRRHDPLRTGGRRKVALERRHRRHRRRARARTGSQWPTAAATRSAPRREIRGRQRAVGRASGGGVAVWQTRGTDIVRR